MPFCARNPGGTPDPSNSIGKIALGYSHRCRWARAEITLDNPLPGTKVASAAIDNTYDYSYLECSVPVGGRSCQTHFIDDAGIAAAAQGIVRINGSEALWDGATPAY